VCTSRRRCGATLIDCPSFEDFYNGVHSRPPFAWQSRLAAQVVEQGWPSQIGVPTGLGKTSAIDIAIWALAAQADRSPRDRTAPTRIWYVVNRRLLVDAASDHAARLESLLATATGDAVAAVAERLQAIEGNLTGNRCGAADCEAAVCSTAALYMSRNQP
jgi:CRISPR-associated endonuclease/helicase Cas3